MVLCFPTFTEHHNVSIQTHPTRGKLIGSLHNVKSTIQSTCSSSPICVIYTGISRNITAYIILGDYKSRASDAYTSIQF